MEQPVRAHRSGTVLALGAVSVALPLLGYCASRIVGVSFVAICACFATIPIGLTAFILGRKQAAGMKAGRIDRAGAGRNLLGQGFGGAACVLAVLLCVALIALFPADEIALMGDGSVVVTKMRYGHVPELHYREVLGSDGALLKEGPFLRWGRHGVKLEEGSYHDGKRDGSWTFRNDDGSIDEAKSGLYENDVRVQSGPSPRGDFDDDDPR